MTTPYALAKKELGVKEISGVKHNSTVVAYFRDAGHPQITDDETAWCAAFVGAMLARAGIKPTGSLAARSYLKWGTPVGLTEVKPGDIVVFQRGDSSWQGHVGFYVKHDATTISVLGGNQANQVSIAKYPQAKLLGIRRGAPVKPHIRDVALTVPGQREGSQAAKNPGSGAKSGLGAVLTVIAAALAYWFADVGERISNWFGG